MSRSNKFLLLCAACALATVAFGVVAARRSKQVIPAGVAPKAVAAEAPKDVPAEPNEPARLEEKKSIPVHESLAPKLVPEVKPASALIYFRANALGEHYGKLSVASVDALDQPTAFTSPAEEECVWLRTGACSPPTPPYCSMTICNAAGVSH
jgi:hypothetical protein